MEEEVCMYQKFWFCKFKAQCKNRHLKDLCKDLSACIDPKKDATKGTLGADLLKVELVRSRGCAIKKNILLIYFLLLNTKKEKK